jgi:hypothetical protein
MAVRKGHSNALDEQRERTSTQRPEAAPKVSGYWQTTLTLSRYCRVRSYLVGARNHGLHAIDAIHTALAGKPWLPATG